MTKRPTLLQFRFLKAAKLRWFSFCMADSTGQELTYGKALVASLVLSRWLRKPCDDARMVGVLLPASVGGALANIALLLAGKIPVNLNFTAGSEATSSAIRQCGIRTILTSRSFLAKAKVEQLDGMLFLEESMKEIGPFEKAATALLAFFLPLRLLQVLYCDGEQDPDSLATVIFSSGSTGMPKGVMLSHRNILSNIDGIAQIFRVTNKDRLMGALPFFHSFGFTGTLWLPLVSGSGVAYHSNPLDAKTIGEMVSKYKATVFISTPTFYSAYLRRCAREQFSSLRYAVVGAEKLRDPLARSFKEKYRLDLLEGYGCTETGPVVSVNIPEVQEGAVRRTGFKAGTVGHPIPGVAVKVVDPDTGKPLPSGEEGLLLVNGPGRMMGYLGQAEKTAEVLQNGWYVTGDIASIDDDGFIKIVDRLSRFSKIGGEMVPHIRVEEAIHDVLDEQGCVVASIPDERKGERLVVFYTQKDIAPEELWDRLNQAHLPKLWIPNRENLHRIEAIPLLGTGKVDLKKLKAMAMECSRV